MLAGRWDKRRKKRKPKHQPAWISCGPQRPTIPLVRACTSFFPRGMEDMDGRDKHGHDEPG
jgi:hypothetical protein